MIQLERWLEHKTHIIWDWNGTLLDDLDLCVQIMNEMLGERGLELLSLERHRALFQMPVKVYYEEIGFVITPEEWPIVAHAFIKRYRELVLERCSLFQGARELLISLRQKSKRQAILSAANESLLNELVLHFGIADLFDHVCGLGDVYAASKLERGFELLANWKVDTSNIVLVGDMDHDLEVGKALGIDVIALGDGHQHSSRLVSKHTKVILSRYACA